MVLLTDKVNTSEVQASIIQAKMREIGIELRRFISEKEKITTQNMLRLTCP